MTDRNYDFCDDPLNELVAADEREAVEWRAVTPRQPRNGRRVLAWDAKNKRAEYLTREGVYWRDGDTLLGNYPITHWMPCEEPVGGLLPSGVRHAIHSPVPS